MRKLLGLVFALVLGCSCNGGGGVPKGVKGMTLILASQGSKRVGLPKTVSPVESEIYDLLTDDLLSVSIKSISKNDKGITTIAGFISSNDSMKTQLYLSGVSHTVYRKSQSPKVAYEKVEKQFSEIVAQASKKRELGKIKTGFVVTYKESEGKVKVLTYENKKVK